MSEQDVALIRFIIKRLREAANGDETVDLPALAWGLGQIIGENGD
jgi:hypothetical protein